METRHPSRDYDSEIAEIVAIAERSGVQVSPVLATTPESQQSTPIIKWVASTDEDDSHADT